MQDLSKTDRSTGRGPDAQRKIHKRGALRVISSRRREAQSANPHKHTSTFAHFYPQQWFLYHTGLYKFNLKFKFRGIDKGHYLVNLTHGQDNYMEHPEEKTHIEKPATAHRQIPGDQRGVRTNRLSLLVSCNPGGMNPSVTTPTQQKQNKNKDPTGGGHLRKKPRASREAVGYGGGLYTLSPAGSRTAER
jgi:hypothetical protein